MTQKYNTEYDLKKYGPVWSELPVMVMARDHEQ